MDKLKIYISPLFSSGVNAAIDAEQRRKVFLTNAISLSIVVFSFIILINDYFIVHNYLAGHRRLILIIALLSVPLFNKLGFHALAKSVLIISPGFAIIIIPVMVKDFFPGQLLWFHYGTAIMTSFPFILFHYKRERVLCVILFLAYLFLTIFIDRILLYYNPVQYGFENELANFTDYKIPPIFLSVFLSSVVLWFNNVNIRYATKLKLVNQELKNTNEELLTKSEQLDDLNKNLEKLVIERSAEIRTKNKQIIEYAHLNAHKVRGPLARIIGLLNLTKHTTDQEEIKELIAKMDFSAQELNEIITEMNEILSEGN
ncbi:ATP-binding protein [Marivirga atlantica]|uniref:Histidine kinase n=1 Tax=Marivirga atlantica TaxID=1548457 RepID=A0A937ACU8_9BACT|nr:hypothetical protein [Marivirga atlantica]MBL0764204.1 hypothetical protein [Marivirga atlantica]